MDAVIRAVLVYIIVWGLLRLAGKRTLSESTTFDFVLLLIIAESTQQALLGDDYSITNAFLLMGTLVGIDVAMSFVKQYFPRVGHMVDGEPLLLVSEGRLLETSLRKARVEREDILEAARRLRGLEKMEQIRYAVLEQSGGITIVPWDRTNR